MALKSYRLFKKGKKKKRRPVRDMVTGGITAIIGVGFLSETASAVSKI